MDNKIVLKAIKSLVDPDYDKALKLEFEGIRQRWQREQLLKGRAVKTFDDGEFWDGPKDAKESVKA